MTATPVVPHVEAVRATCHCGAVELAVRLTDGLATARRCDCSFCARRGAVAVTALVADVTVVRGHDALATYVWGTGTARHHFCRVCGIYTHHRRRSNPAECGVNAACIDGVDLRALDPVPWADGRNHPSDRR